MVHIKVAVRIRPMSTKEACQKESSIVINSDNCVLVNNPKVPERNDGGDSRQKTRRFAVDYCYDPKYPQLSTQQAVFEEIGSEVLGHMFDGYNACVLAYGHSASGKTYTMMGTAEDPGITPRICRELCRRMRTRPDIKYYVSVSFLEIYNEKVRDLLVEPDPHLSPAFSLRVREHPKLGPYVQDLSEHVIEKEEDLLSLLNLGNSRRRTAATESNTHSSRSHAVFTIRFKQVSNKTTKSSKVHLVDLAGSERASLIQNRARLKEGANINKSLVTLGNVISALADCGGAAYGKAYQPFVPYRDSVLTWLLKDTLGGNSNTIMIATISPASSCFSDTINTLRYAKRTKRIINQPLVNEDPKVRTIRELREEVSRLKAILLSYSSKQMDSALGDVRNEDKEVEENDDGGSSKWKQLGAALCAVPRKPRPSLPQQITTANFPQLRWISVGQEMGSQLANDLLEHLGVNPSSPTGSSKSLDKQGNSRNISTLDILSTTSANKQSSCDLVYVGEINAENSAGVNRVIVDSTKQAPRSSLSQIVPRVAFKRRRSLLRRGSLYWTMLHRSRPDLIKGISTRSAEGSSATQADVLSQSTSDNSLHSSGSTESRSRTQKPASLSRTSSIGDASGSSTPTQPPRTSIVRKKENKRAEIVASVTSRLYATKKKPDHRLEALQAEKENDDDDDELEELKLCKRARMKLFDLSRKLAMAKKVKRTVDSECQTEFSKSTLRVKEKCIATDQQGVVKTQTCATNTSETESSTTDSSVVMNQIFLGGKGKIVFDYGANFQVEVPGPETIDSGSQTLPQSVDQCASPRKLFSEISPPDEFFSDDSLDSDDERKKRSHFKQINSKFNSFQNINNSITPLYKTALSKSYPNVTYKSMSDNGKNKNISFTRIHANLELESRIEKIVKPISRFSISGTNAFFEYNPNKYENEKLIFSDKTSTSTSSSNLIPEIIYPKYPTDSNESLSKSSCTIDEDTNSSSETASASNVSSLGSSDSSSDDFIFIENSPSSPNVPRDLYTIAENSESCSNRSSPINCSSLKLETNTEETQTTSNEETVTNKKQVKWSELECLGKKQFLNFKYRPSNFNESKTKDESSETLFPSQDSVTFVFLGNKEQQTSVLMNLIKRSLLNSSDSTDLSRRSKATQSSSKLMRSVSIDTAMIALSRIARNQRSTDISRTVSLSNVSTEVQVNLDENNSIESSTQCNISKESYYSTSESCQCDLDRSSTQSLGTNTTNDRETLTDAELRESQTQTDVEILFDKNMPELPRRSISPRVNGSDEPKKFSEGHWKEMKQLILGTGRDLFPQYLENIESPERQQSQEPRKTVSWSDVCNTDKEVENEECQDICKNPGTRKVRFCEPEKANTLPRRKIQTAEVVSEFIKEATDLLYELNNPEASENSSSYLLQKRGKTLSRIKLMNDKEFNESSVQTETEKVSAAIQTGSFASSLIGPPVRRSLTPNLRREFHEEIDNSLTSTWPRRRVSSKPPTGLKGNSPRSNSSVRSFTPTSRNGVSPRNNSITSDLSFESGQAAYRRSPGRQRSISRSPDLTNNSAIESAYRNLKIEIERDRARQRNFENCMELYANSDKKNYTDSYLHNSRYKYDNVSDFRLNERYLNSQIHEQISNGVSERCSVNCMPFKSASELVNDNSNDCRSHFRIDRHSYGNSKFLSSQEDILSSNCRCFCHDLTCKSSIDRDLQNCHTCCVPCSTDPPSFTSDASISPSLSYESPLSGRRRGSPLAHLNHLIALRRSIVAAQKANNFHAM